MARASSGPIPTPARGEAFRDPTAEWLESDGLGGYAMGCASDIRTRRYHALLVTALTPPTGRHVLVSDLETWIETPGGRFALSSHRYAGDVVHPDGAGRIRGFEHDPWPRWHLQLEDGTELEHERLVVPGVPAIVLRWRLARAERSSSKRARARAQAILTARPLIAARDAHALAHENPVFRFDAERAAGRVTWRPYAGLPVIAAYSNAEYAHAPDWYRNFLYTEERARGLDFTEDLATPGILSWDLARGDAVCVLVAEFEGASAASLDAVRRAAAAEPTERPALVTRAVNALFAVEGRRRHRFVSPLHRAADAYFSARGRGETLIAGYPWFTDWGRDTFIALRGLCLAGGHRLVDAGRILQEWSGTVTDGLVPNQFVDAGGAPEFNTVDGALWLAVAVHDFLEAMEQAGRRPTRSLLRRFEAAVLAIVEGYAAGTRFGIRLDRDGLIAAGEPGVALTWMDARIDGRPVTPRIGKPVEIQALWLNALRCASRFTERWDEVFVQGLASFRERFWNEATDALYDVIDVDHRPGAVDGSIRPNMLFAVGGVPFAPLTGDRARRIVDVAERELWTPLGPRSLSPRDPAYRPRYEGDMAQRDGAYHQGTVWPWLAGPFVEAWVRVHGDTLEARREGRRRFVEPILEHLEQAGLGHVSEIADGDAPHRPRGCPFQAWSVGELLRLLQVVLDERRPSGQAALVPAAASELAGSVRA